MGRPRIVPAGPRIVKAKNRRGKWTDTKVIGYVALPYIQIFTDLGWRTVDPRIVYLK